MSQYKITSISPMTTDNALWTIERCLMLKYGTLQAQKDMDPLRWYIFTGRCSISFLRAVINAKPFMIARKLHEGGSTEEAIDRVRRYLKTVFPIDDRY